MKYKNRTQYMTKHLDKSLIKGKDLGLFNEVMDYLRYLNLEAKLEGEIKNKSMKGNFRSYQKINIVAKSEYSIWSLLKSQYHGTKPEKDTLFFPKEVTMHEVAHSYEIKQNSPRTIILLEIDSNF